MNDIMRPMPFAHLMNWTLSEYHAQGSVLGVSKLVRHTGGEALPIFEERIESPYGPAAGPRTQLAQDIIAAYATGSCFFEVKTVQVMDGEELSRYISKSCITAADECYNCGWFTEFYVPQAFTEYVKAWFAYKLLAEELGLGDPDGFVFNISVDYNLKSIQSPEVDAYIEGMKDAPGTEMWQGCTDWALANSGRFGKMGKAYVRSIAPHMSNPTTESTLHDCPPDEIEHTATHFITEKNLNTYVKCNPTLLGYEFAHETLDGLGYDYIQFDDHHLREDLQREDAAPTFHRLVQRTGGQGLESGVKITGTFPMDMAAGKPPNEEMYISGRSLYPLSLSLMTWLARGFKDRLRISYSGGTNIYSVRVLSDADIWPITMATTVLKPGGYQRFSQIGRALLDISYAPWEEVGTARTAALAEGISADGYYQKPMKPIPSHKLGKKVPLIDYFSALCRSDCPIEQDISAYLMKTGEGRYEETLRIIIQRNALPLIAGTICSHRYQDKCMRNAYDESVYIRAQKLKAVEGGFGAPLSKLRPATPATGRRMAVVGGGPGGMPAVYFLGCAGVDVTVFERRDVLGGIVRHVILAFCIPDEAIDNDIRLMETMGVKVELNTEVKDVQEFFTQSFTHVVLTIGAWQGGSIGLEYSEEHNVIEFLKAAKKTPDTLNPGRHVVVTGGGSTAMDAARTARRLPGVETVPLVYRRTRRYMPADQGKLELALVDGVEFRKLFIPVDVRDDVPTCKVVELDTPGIIGRRFPVNIGWTAEVFVGMVITTVGEKVDTELYTVNDLFVDQRGRAVVNPDTLEFPVKHVFVVGDDQKGPGTVAKAIAGAARTTQAIHSFDVDAWVEQSVNSDYQKPLAGRSDVCTDYVPCEDSRCLGCTTVCEIYTEVCPNWASVTVQVSGIRQHQIIHADGMCNKCDNCATFCPYDGRPYQDKFTLFWCADDFGNSRGEDSLHLEDDRTRVRLDGQVADYDMPDTTCDLYDPLRHLTCAVYENYAYLLG